MAKLFDGANRYILFIQLLALRLGVCFISPSLQLSEKRLLPRNTEAVECDSLVGNSTCMCQDDGVWSGSYSNTSIVIISESTPITAGNTGVFVCVAHGCPVPSLTWSRDGTPLGNSPRSTILEELVNENGVTFVQSILVICSLEEDDTAQYNCSVSNNISFASASFNLTVNSVECDSLVGDSTCMCQADEVWPGSDSNTSIVIISESTPITAGNTGVFVCVAHGCPVPSLTWSRDGTPLGNSSRLTILEELVNENGVTFVQSILVICSLEEDDTAQYNCSASNNVSFASASFNLTVNSLNCTIETTGLLSWPPTLAGITQTFKCPNTTTMISRTCSLSGVWEDVDLTLCISLDSINPDNITLDNYDQVLSNVSGAVRGAATSEQEQTTSHLTVVAAAFEKSAAQLARTDIPRTTVQNLINTLEGLQQWNKSVLQENISNIVNSYERIVSTFAQQLEDGDPISLMSGNILVVTELLLLAKLNETGRSFSSGGQTRNTSINTLSENETAAVFLPASLYQSITNRNSTGSFYAVYNSGALFPTTNAMTVVGSPVLAATVGSGLNFNNLTVPVRILLRLNELENISSREPQCVSWNFGEQEWTTDGCETDLPEVNEGVVTCNCSHLTNFAVLTNVICRAEPTGLLFWPNTLAGTNYILQCPNTTTMISRTCSLSGVWEDVDLTLCTSFDSINPANITPDNYEEVLTSISGAVRGAAINEQVQTRSNLATVADVFQRTAALINKTTNITNTTVKNLVNILKGLQKWNVDVLRANASNIVRSYEAIVSTFAQQLNEGDNFSVSRENILFVAEALSKTELVTSGRSFSSGGQTGNTSISTLSENETAAVFLPASLFQSITDRNTTSIGIFYTVYTTGALFPIRLNATEGTNASVKPVVGSPVLAVTVGPRLNFSNLTEPVRILLRLNELENVTDQRCVSWDFSREEWTTDGCVGVEVNESVVTCNCSHLTNFAILVDICSRFQDCMPSPLQTALQTLTIVGVVLSLTGIGLTVFTLLFFKKFRERDVTIFHVELCTALFCLLIIFVCGIDRTAIYGACVAVSALIHYFTLVAVMFMGAEAVLMFQKLVLVFGSTSTKFFITVSLICWLVPIIPVVIPMAVDLSDVVSRDLVVRVPTPQIRGFCFIRDPAVFFGAFLGPIFAILILNVVIFVLVITVLIKHTRNKLDRTKQQMNNKTAIKLLVNTAGIMFLFGLTWLFGALTVTGFGSATASFAFQVLFVICNAFQGFFIFLFFCVFNKDARDLWLELLSCGHYKSKPLRSSQAKYANLGAPGNTASSGLPSNTASAMSNKGGDNLSIDDPSKYKRFTDTPLTSTAEQKDEDPWMGTFKGDSKVHETNVGTEQRKMEGGQDRVGGMPEVHSNKVGQ